MDYKTIVTIREKLNQAFHEDLEGQDDWNVFMELYPNIFALLKFINDEKNKF